MMNLFKKAIDTRPKTTQSIVADIHQAFYNEVDVLLAEAKIEVPPVEVDPVLKEKAERLRKVGFGSVKAATELQEIESRMREAERENTRKKQMQDVVNYFSNRYPMYRFITEQSVNRICEQYGLVYSSVGNYIGDVPEENLKHIENFKIDENDEAWAQMTHAMWSGFSQIPSSICNYVPYWEVKDIESRYNENPEMHLLRQNYYYAKCPLEIVAPARDFKQEGLERQGNRLVTAAPKDPIVLQPVIFNGFGQKHYLIVTAWGLESTDPDVFNASHN
jgi:hypothetical protein